jgi:hypothetical protein
MATRVRTTSPGLRLQIGASVLSGARGIDTRPVKARLESFERVHRGYVAAQRKVDVAESQLRDAQARLAECDATQDEAVIALAGALIGEGQPYTNAFEAFGVPAPKTLTRLRSPEAVAAVHQLVAAVQRSKGISEATLKAAEAADKAAGVVEEALAPIAKLQDNVRHARRVRDAQGQGWESALAALRLDARSAAYEGAPDLYTALFPPPRPAAKSKTPEEPTTTVTEPPPAATNAA